MILNHPEILHFVRNDNMGVAGGVIHMKGFRLPRPDKIGTRKDNKRVDVPSHHEILRKAQNDSEKQNGNGINKEKNDHTY